MTSRQRKRRDFEAVYYMENRAVGEYPRPPANSSTVTTWRFCVGGRGLRVFKAHRIRTEQWCVLLRL